MFAEVGGAWLERFWTNRLRRLLGMLRQNSAARSPVHAIQADAADVPLKDGAASAVVWDPPYYDNVDYDIAAEPYQAVLAAMLPALVSEPRVRPQLTRHERIATHDLERVRQASAPRRTL